MISIILSVLDEDKKEKVQEIYNRLGNTMYSIALGILRDKHHAQDAVSETFIKISTYIEKISKLSSHEIDPYCIVILKNESYKIYNQNKKEFLIEEIEIKSKDEELLEDLVINNLETKEKITRYLNILSKEERTLLYFRYMDNMTFKEIGKYFEISEESARKRHQRILEKMRIISKEGEKNDRN